MRCAGEVGVETACEVLQPRQRPLLAVSRALFQGSLPVLPEGQEYLQVFRVNGISKECDLGGPGRCWTWWRPGPDTGTSALCAAT